MIRVTSNDRAVIEQRARGWKFALTIEQLDLLFALGKQAEIYLHTDAKKGVIKMRRNGVELYRARSFDEAQRWLQGLIRARRTKAK